MAGHSPASGPSSSSSPRPPTPQTGPTVTASYDPNWYATGIKITDTQMRALPLTHHDWHGDWNYTLTAA